MTYFVKWDMIGRDGTAVSPAPHETPRTAFAYAHTVAEVLSAMGVDEPRAAVWVEDSRGERVEEPPKTTDS